jgi:predicted GNAT superfamily acetyltransferase
MRPPAISGQMMLIGQDNAGIGAVAWTENISGPGHVFIKAIGIAKRHRNRGGGAADELLQELKDRLASIADAAGAADLIIEGRVHPNNEASKRCLARAGGGTAEMEDGYELWVLPTIVFETGDARY